MPITALSWHILVRILPIDKIVAAGMCDTHNCKSEIASPDNPFLHRDFRRLWSVHDFSPIRQSV